jgi:hypothetical protein
MGRARLRDPVFTSDRTWRGGSELGLAILASSEPNRGMNLATLTIRSRTEQETCGEQINGERDGEAPGQR